MKTLLLRNSAKCLNCNEEIESTHRHDFVRCSCGNVMVDGGHWYCKRGVVPNARYEDTSKSVPVSEDIYQAIVRLPETLWVKAYNDLIDGMSPEKLEEIYSDEED